MESLETFETYSNEEKDDEMVEHQPEEVDDLSSYRIALNGDNGTHSALGTRGSLVESLEMNFLKQV
jgi:hypothetical protein